MDRRNRAILQHRPLIRPALRSPNSYAQPSALPVLRVQRRYSTAAVRLPDPGAVLPALQPFKMPGTEKNCWRRGVHFGLPDRAWKVYRRGFLSQALAQQTVILKVGLAQPAGATQ